MMHRPRLWRIVAALASPAMRILDFPGDVAMGALEVQADRLAEDAARAAAEAEALAMALLRGDWRALARTGNDDREQLPA